MKILADMKLTIKSNRDLELMRLYILYLIQDMKILEKGYVRNETKKKTKRLNLILTYKCGLDL